MVMEISERVVGDVTILRLKGRMILEEGEVPLKAAVDGLLRQGRDRILLDMADVSYIDSAGVGMIVSKYVSVHRHGGRLKLMRVTPRVARVLQVTKLSSVFAVFDAEPEAVASFAGP